MFQGLWCSLCISHLNCLTTSYNQQVKNGGHSGIDLKIDLKIIIQSKVSQKEKDKYRTIHLHVESEMTQTNLSMKQKRTHRHREQTCGCRGGWRRDGLGVWD